MRCAIALAILLTTTASTNAQWLEEGCQPLLEVAGTAAGALFGDRVEGVGDVNDDGVPDFAVSVPFHLTNRGRVGVYSGADGAVIWTRDGTLTSMILGFALDVLDDINGDGVREVVASGPFNNGSGGFVFVYSGADGTTLKTFQGDPTGSIGYSLATGGDFDGDGVKDLAIADGGHDGIEVNAGRVRVYSTDGFALIAEIDPPTSPVARFGTSMSFMGDADDDGRDDLAIGDRYVSSDPPGRLHVFTYDGTSPQLRYTIEPVNLGCTLCGDTVDGGRDVDGDGHGDFIIGEAAPDDRARVFSGPSGALLTDSGETRGITAILIDDVTGDGRADFATGERGNDDGAVDAGRVTVHAGTDGSVVQTMTSTVADTSFGTRLGRLADMNGDGAPELLVGARAGIGHVFVMAGLGGGSQVPGDVDGDGLVGVSDLLAVLSAWGPCGGCPEDLDDDGMVGVTDLLAVLAGWT